MDDKIRVMIRDGMRKQIGEEVWDEAVAAGVDVKKVSLAKIKELRKDIARLKKVKQKVKVDLFGEEELAEFFCGFEAAVFDQFGEGDAGGSRHVAGA